jgi:oxygen-dependent protoporphyrinogen oxidase
VTRSGSDWQLEIETPTGPAHVEHGAVLYAGTAFKLAELEVHAGSPVDLKPFGEIRYPPVASVVLGFRREDVAHPCDGFGMLIPRVEGFKILGSIFSSALFPNRAPAGHLTLTSYIGGERYPELAALPPEQLYATVLADLRRLLGVRGQPTFQHSVFWPKAIPQYNLGYGKYRALLTDIERRTPGLFFAGHYRDGISLGDSIVSGINIVDRIAAHLGPGKVRA